MSDLASIWFSLSRPVDRRIYAATGLVLAAIKYLVDAAMVWSFTGTLWSPLGYLHPTLANPAQQTPALFAALAAWSLPFYWVGVSMTVRRAMDAGLAPAWGLLFFVPILNYLTMLVLCILPTSARQRIAGETARASWGLVLTSAGAGTAVGAAMVLISVVWLREYGASLFLGAPFVMGFVAGFLLNRDAPRSVGATLAVGFLADFIAAGVILSIALEGIFCLLMALPLALLLTSLGVLLGRQVARMVLVEAAVMPLVLLAALPLLTGFESLGLRAPLREVATALEIDAPPDAVWPNVIAISELPPPTELPFRLGIAYPMRARIEGSGPGAVRTCEFSTGAFVEPITDWEPPRRLAFSVRSQPPTMQEWSFYAHVDAPHLVTGLRSERGEFRLVPIGNGRTRLEGSTWYRNNLFPQAYWNLWSDALIHRIHLRVLAHVKRSSEAGARS